MVTKVKPRLGWQRVYSSSNDPLPKDFCEKLLGLFRHLDDKQSARIGIRLEQAARRYRVWQHSLDNEPSPSEVRAALSDVERTSYALFQLLEDIDDRSRSLLNAALANHRTIYSINDEAERILSIHSAALVARDDLDLKRREKQALPIAIGDLAAIFKEATGRNWTRDFHRGSPLTVGARFAVAFFSFVDPSVSRSAINAAMKANISAAQRRNGAGHKSG